VATLATVVDSDGDTTFASSERVEPIAIAVQERKKATKKIAIAAATILVVIGIAVGAVVLHGRRSANQSVFVPLPSATPHPTPSSAPTPAPTADDRLNGYHEIHYDNGDSYAGNFVNDVRSGKGEMIYADGRFYDGEWVNDERNGQGKMTTPDGRVWEGEWGDDALNGYGLFVGTGGETYDGEWKDGEPTGIQKITFADGSTYEGEVISGVYNGYGKLSLAEIGKVFEGMWADGTFLHGNIYDIPPQELENAFRIGAWPLSAETYDPALDGQDIPIDAEVYGLFDTAYEALPTPTVITNYQQASSMASLSTGKWFLLIGSSGFNYVILIN